jgi:hypothetical protein
MGVVNPRWVKLLDRNDETFLYVVPMQSIHVNHLRQVEDEIARYDGIYAYKFRANDEITKDVIAWCADNLKGSYRANMFFDYHASSESRFGCPFLWIDDLTDATLFMLTWG